MDLQKIIKHHRYEAEHAQRLRALVAANFHIKAAEPEPRWPHSRHAPRCKSICGTGSTRSSTRWSIRSGATKARQS